MKSKINHSYSRKFLWGGVFSAILLTINIAAYSQSLDVTFNPSMYMGGYHISCNGASDGSLEAIIVGGQPPYAFQWSTGAFTKTITGLTAGTYSITVTDAAQASITKSYTLIASEAMNGSLTKSEYGGGYNVSAQGASDGWITAVIGGGATPYSYQWSNGAESETNHDLSSGSYSVIVRDVNQCQLQLSANMTQPTPLHIVSITSPLHNGYNLSCKGSEDGAIDLTVSGGVSPYTYQWSNGNFTQDLADLKAGEYTVLVKDLNGVGVTASITLTQPASIEVELSAPTYPNGHHTTCYNCSNGSVTTTVTGGVMPYMYSWNTGQSTQNLANLMAGTYAVQVTDANGCTKTDIKIDLTQPDRDDWTMLGNSGTDPSQQFIGTTDSSDFVFRTAGVERMRLKENGGVLFSGMQGTGGAMLLLDSSGTLVRQGISNYAQPCSGPVAFPWLQSPFDWANVFSCYNRFGIGTDHPRERLDVLGTVNIASWNNENNLVKISHDNANGQIAAEGTGDLLINYNSSKGVKICTGPSATGSFQSGGDVFLATRPTAKCRIGGTTGQDYVLEVNHDDQIKNGIRLNKRPGNAAGMNSQIRFDYDNQEKWSMGNDLRGDGGDNFFLWSQSEQDAVILIQGHQVSIGGGLVPAPNPASPYRLFVDAGICAREVKVTASASWWGDYVFDKDYPLLGLDSLKAYIDTHGHLPEIPSAKEVLDNSGFDLGAMQVTLLKKIEEQTLYILQLKAEVDALKAKAAQR